MPKFDLAAAAIAPAQAAAVAASQAVPAEPSCARRALGLLRQARALLIRSFRGWAVLGLIGCFAIMFHVHHISTRAIITPEEVRQTGPSAPTPHPAQPRNPRLPRCGGRRRLCILEGI